MPKFAQFKIDLYIQIQIYTVLHAQVEILLYLQRMRFELLAAGSVGLSLLVLTTPLRHSFSSSLNRNTSYLVENNYIWHYGNSS